MKKFSVLLIVLAVMIALVSCATKAPEAEVAAAEPVAAEPVADANVCPFAGEYYVEFTSQDSTDKEPGESFIVGEDWTVSGAMEGSGMTGFQGVIMADGTFTAEFTRLGGTLTGTIDAEGKLNATGETRGRTSTITGYRL